MLLHSAFLLPVSIMFLLQAGLMMGAPESNLLGKQLDRRAGRASWFTNWFSELPSTFDWGWPWSTSTPSQAGPIPNNTPASTPATPVPAAPPTFSRAPLQATTSPASVPKSTSLPVSPPAGTSEAFKPSSTSLPLASSTPVAAAPATPIVKPGTCSEIRIHKEWRKLSRQEQMNYISAVKCLTVKPSKLMPGGSYRRYDDFENVHSRMRNKIHWIAPFLPWHRNFMFLYEKVLRDECGLQGGLPRWDWTLDSNDMTQAPIWSADPQTGFGTNGQNFTQDLVGLGGGTVEDGAFANLQLYYPENHLLERNYNLPAPYEQDGRTWGSQFYDEKAMAVVHAKSSFQTFSLALEGTDPTETTTNPVGPHAIIHVIIGGEISPTAYAANEPLFYLHHSNVDYIWWKWQNAKPRTRLTEYSGITIRGSTVRNAKLSDSLEFLKLGEDPTVRDTLDTTAYPYCYKYE